MGKIIYIINAILGMIIGLIVAIFSIVGLVKEFSANSFGLLIAGLVAIGFGIYEWKKYKLVQ